MNSRGAVSSPNSPRESYPPSWMNFLVDVYILSYPKCGRTWLRLMLGKVLALRIIPELQVATDPPLKHDSSTNAAIKRYRVHKARS